MDSFFRVSAFVTFGNFLIKFHLYSIPSTSGHRSLVHKHTHTPTSHWFGVAVVNRTIERHQRQFHTAAFCMKQWSTHKNKNVYQNARNCCDFVSFRLLFLFSSSCCFIGPMVLHYLYERQIDSVGFRGFNLFTQTCSKFSLSSLVALFSHFLLKKKNQFKVYARSMCYMGYRSAAVFFGSYCSYRQLNRLNKRLQSRTTCSPSPSTHFVFAYIFFIDISS